MSKPLFFTGRKEISRDDVAIRLLERPGQLSRFEARFDLAGYALPPDAFVIVEAYHSAYLERFALGTVANSEAVEAKTLVGLEPGERPLFRLKVIASNDSSRGQLLAAIDRVRPTTDDDNGTARSLLPLVPKSRDRMGDELWRIHFAPGEEQAPELWINQDVHGLFPALQNQDARVTALIMPEVLRQVLRGLVEYETEWTEEGVLGQWLVFAKEFHPDEFEEWDPGAIEASLERRRAWVDEVVRGFTASHRFFERYQEQLGATPEEVNDA